MQVYVHSNRQRINSIWKDSQAVYLQYKMTQTLSMVNPPICTTNPGIRFTSLLDTVKQYIQTTKLSCTRILQQKKCFAGDLCWNNTDIMLNLLKWLIMTPCMP